MKKLIMINGTMGVGKSTVCKLLLGKLTPGVWLDGDWCWNMNPFVVNEENKAMVLSNITNLLRAYLHNFGYEYIIFCWVIHQEDIFEQLLEPLQDCDFELFKISLTCSASELKKRLWLDVEKGIREVDVIERSTTRLPLYEYMDTFKVDVSDITPEQAAQIIKKKVELRIS